MDFKCNAAGGNKWKLKITPDSTGKEEPDGELEVDPEDAGTGDFNGKHHKGGNQIPVTGKCKKSASTTECTDAQPCHIEFDKDEDENGQSFHWHYEADFRRVGQQYVTIDGTAEFKKRRNHTAAEASPGQQSENRLDGEDEGTWVGIKPVT